MADSAHAFYLGRKMIDLTAEQQQLTKIVHDYTCRFPVTKDGDTPLLQGCYDYNGGRTAHQKYRWTISACNILDFFALQNGWSYWPRVLQMGSLRFPKDH
jgi:hypothetical protein